MRYIHSTRSSSFPGRIRQVHCPRTHRRPELSYIQPRQISGKCLGRSASDFTMRLPMQTPNTWSWFLPHLQPGPGPEPLLYAHCRIRQEGRTSDQTQEDSNVAWEQKDTYLVPGGCGNTEVTDRHCGKVSPIEPLLQYRFATPKPLKARRSEDRCVIAPLCNPPLVDGRGGADAPQRSSMKWRHVTLFIVDLDLDEP